MGFLILFGAITIIGTGGNLCHVNSLSINLLTLFYRFSMDFFLNKQNWQIGNRQSARDILDAINKAQRQNYSSGFKNSITRNTCDIPKLKINKQMFI